MAPLRVDPIQEARDSVGGNARSPAAAGHESFSQTLQRVESAVTVSRHARERLEQRGIALDDGVKERVGRAVDRAEARGAKVSLVLLEDLAVLVDIRKRTVITALQSGGQEAIFTDIDSAVIA
jgi:flagellar operon protein